jgi:hypothetical protein
MLIPISTALFLALISFVLRYKSKRRKRVSISCTRCRRMKRRCLSLDGELSLHVGNTDVYWLCEKYDVDAVKAGMTTVKITSLLRRRILISFD